MEKFQYTTLSNHLIGLYGEKVYKIALNAGLSCPNRDGLLDTRGCIFCSEGGSGDFAGAVNLDIQEQITAGKLLLSKKCQGTKFIAYFQAFTNTHAPVAKLRKIFEPALQHPDIVGISIATRPDCLSVEVLNLLSEINAKKKLWIELGLQTIHENTAHFIRRHYPLSRFDQAVTDLNQRSIDIVVHLILGLPGETNKDMLQSVEYVVSKPIQGLKLQLLHILQHTDLATFYQESPFPLMTLDEYADLVVDCLLKVPEPIVIHRITGDAPRHLLIAPEWSSDKKKVLNTIHHRLKLRKGSLNEYRKSRTELK